MAMYIDTVTPSLNSLTESVGGLQKLRDATIAQRIEKAKLLRDMGENLEAEKELYGAKNYGLSSLFAKSPQEWEADNPFAGQPQDMVEKKGLQQLQESPELYGGVNATQGKILAEMEKLYGGKTPQYYNQLQVMGLEAGGIDPNKALTVALNKSLSPEYSGIAAMNYPNVKAQLAEYKALQADQKLQDKEIAAKNAPLIKANAQAEAYNKLADIENAKREAYNKNLPSGKLSGNEVDQQQSLMKSTLSAVKAGGGMDAYMRYLTTHKAIDDHYGHNSKPLPPEYFGLGGKGGGGSKKEHFIIQATDGKEYTVQVPKGVAFADAIPTVNAQLAKLAGKGITYQTGTNPQPKGDVSGDTESINLTKDEKKQERDINAKAAAMMAWNEADPSGLDFGVFKKKEKADLANSMLPPDSPYKWDSSGNLNYVGKSKSNVASGNKVNKPWK